MKRKKSKKQKRKTYKKKSKGGNKLKIALVFCGQPRFTYGTSFDSIKKNLLDNYDCDVYAHFWLSDGKGGSALPDNTNPNTNKININIEEFKNSYNPIEIKIENPLNVEEVLNPLKNIPNFNFINTNVERYNSIYKNISRFTSSKRSFLLIKNISKYDFIINIRSDLIIEKMPNLNTLSKDKIYSILRNDKCKYIDQINIISNKYAHFFFNLIDIFNELYIKYGSGEFMPPEDIMYHMFEYNNLLQYCEGITKDDFITRLNRGTHEQLN
jgi:hypothetical protein